MLFRCLSACALAAAVAAPASAQIRTTFSTDFNDVTPTPALGAIPGTPITFDSSVWGIFFFPFPTPTTPPGGVGSNVASSSSLSGDISFDGPVAELSVVYASGSTVSLTAFDAAGAALGTANGAATFDPLTGTFGFETLSFVFEGNDIASATFSNAGAPGDAALDSITVVQVSEPIDVFADFRPYNWWWPFPITEPLVLHGRGPARVGVFSTCDFDATTILESTVTLGDPLLSGAISAVNSFCFDINCDGLLDVIFDFGKVRDLTAAGALAIDTTELEITGETSDGDAIVGVDDVRVIY
ncbi:MAG: hypothetical protein AAFX79_12295 [Planctomycetota bacterium]